MLSQIVYTTTRKPIVFSRLLLSFLLFENHCHLINAAYKLVLNEILIKNFHIQLTRIELETCRENVDVREYFKIEYG